MAPRLTNVSVALSANGNTALIAGPAFQGEYPAAAYIFTRSGTAWTQQTGPQAQRERTGVGSRTGPRAPLRRRRPVGGWQHGAGRGAQLQLRRRRRLGVRALWFDLGPARPEAQRRGRGRRWHVWRDGCAFRRRRHRSDRWPEGRRPSGRGLGIRALGLDLAPAGWSSLARASLGPANLAPASPCRRVAPRPSSAARQTVIKRALPGAHARGLDLEPAGPEARGQ